MPAAERGGQEKIVWSLCDRHPWVPTLSVQDLSPTIHIANHAIKEIKDIQYSSNLDE
jgi:hypothetical protein